MSVLAEEALKELGEPTAKRALELLAKAGFMVLPTQDTLASRMILDQAPGNLPPWALTIACTVAGTVWGALRRLPGPRSLDPVRVQLRLGGAKVSFQLRPGSWADNLDVTPANGEAPVPGATS